MTIFNRDYAFSLPSGAVSDLAFNYEPIIKAFSESEYEVTQTVQDAAKGFCSLIDSMKYEGYVTPSDVINDFLNRL